MENRPLLKKTYMVKYKKEQNYQYINKTQCPNIILFQTID